ncbi:hypothetical protein AAHA92_18890 [Salvia divinorum]|uniref:Uncharacterized protein n=1 Tax=Salvia divinorum TaxID=28513 RepID=A0ABD1H3J3_SALDI
MGFEVVYLYLRFCRIPASSGWERSKSSLRELPRSASKKQAQVSSKEPASIVDAPLISAPVSGRSTQQHPQFDNRRN